MNNLVRHSFILLILITLQVIIFNHITLFNLATPFVFLVAILMFPVNFPIIAYYITAFLTGLIIDWLSAPLTIGIHAFATLLIASIRRYIILLTTTSSSFLRSLDEVSLGKQDYVWYVLYLLPLIFVHHLAYFFLESYPIKYIGWTILKIFTSTVYTFVVSYMICILFYKE